MTKPKINPPLTTMDILVEAISGIILIYMIIQLIVEYPGLGDKVVTHFDARGNPDGWGNKSTLLILPLVTIGLYAGLTILNRYPYIFNYPISISEENSHKQYQLAKSMLSILKAGIVGMFAYIQYISLGNASEQTVGLGAFFIIIVMIVSFGPIIMYFIQATKYK